MAEKTIHNLQTNEEIIEELTKDFEVSNNLGDDIQPQKKEELKKFSSENDPLENLENKSEEEKEDESPINPVDDDLSDEESLKDRDAKLTEAEKEILRNQSIDVKKRANELFKSSEFEEALIMYSQALKICPLVFSKERAILYGNRAAAKSKMPMEKESAIRDCTKAIELDSNYVKAYLRRANLYEEHDQLDRALDDHKKILELDPQNVESNCAVRKLQPIVAERNEKLKQEMLGKLKDLGNLILKPFGLSTENFELQQNPESQGYSVKFKQNPK